MFDFHKDHVKLVTTIFVVFVFLSVCIAIIPAYKMQDSVAPLTNQKRLSESDAEGLQVYVSENCMSCHTQQVRNIEMDKIWGSRPSIPSDYFYSKNRMDTWRQSPSLLGSERTGPDLTNVGQRQPGIEWHLLHLYNPRIVVKESIMPAYSWLFIEKEQTDSTDIVVPIPKKYLQNKSAKVVATPEAINLVTYLQSLKQTSIETITEQFIPAIKTESVNTISDKNESILPDGKQLYLKTCAACHQENGTGLPGAFPALAGSKIVNDPNAETMIKIILQGYDARAEFGVMPSFIEQLSDEEIAAIANHERTSWGNTAQKISATDVKRIRDLILMLNQ